MLAGHAGRASRHGRPDRRARAVRRPAPRHRRHLQERGALPPRMDRLSPRARGRALLHRRQRQRRRHRRAPRRRSTAAGSSTHLPFPGRPGRAAAAAGLRRDPAPRTAARPTGSPSSTPTSSCCPAPPSRRARRGSSPRLGADPSVGAVAVNWAVYGSSGERDGRAGAVIERFAGRAERQTLLLNRHYKSILRPAAVAAGCTQPAPLPPRRRPSARCMPTAPAAAAADVGPNGLSREVRLGAAPAQPLRGEVARGVPDPQAAARPGHQEPACATAGFFAAHDRNEVRPTPVDPADCRLRARMRAAGSPAPSRPAPGGRQAGLPRRGSTRPLPERGCQRRPPQRSSSALAWRRSR